MYPTDQSQPLSPARPHLRKVGTSFWRKLGGGSLSISIIVHAILLALGVIWIFQIIPAPKENIDFMPKGGGGGTPGQKSETATRKRATMTSMNAPRVAAKGAASTFTLPEPDAATAISAVGSLGSGAMSGGFGGSGAGGGRGDGKGKGFGSGAGPGMGGSALGMNPFGMLNPTANQFTGNIYDYYQTRDGKPSKHPQNGTGANNLPWLEPLVTSYIESGWRDEKLKSYFKGPATLGITQLLIPRSPDTAAPEAFQAGGKMTGGAWVAIYRGTVTAPETTEIRFIGTADNFLAVRMNNRNVVTFGCGNKPSGILPGTLRMPLAAGDWVRVNKGGTYDFDILIGDAGGLFSASLCYEKKDQPGKWFLFRTEATDFAPILAKDVNDVPKNIEKDSPVWPCKANSIRF